jgi:threonine dehydrogenase-like Zn-dependent dehydrogenase
MTMKAVVLKGPGKLSFQDVPKPSLEKGYVMVKVKACGICGSDLRYFEGENPWSLHTLGKNAPIPDNIILGHEMAGEICEVHDKEDEWMLGKSVGVLAYNTCGKCEFCRTGRENLCRQTMHIGHGAGWSEMEFYPGGMAEYCPVWSTHVFPFSESLSCKEVSTLDFFAVGMHAVKLAPSLVGEDVAIIGSGPLGLAISQIVRVFGARTVFCSDTYDAVLDIALSMGANYAVNAGMDDISQAIMEKTAGRGVMAVFDTVGSGTTQSQGLASLGYSGALVNLVANFEKAEYRLVALSGERSIRSSANNPFGDFQLVLKLMESGRLDANPMITHVLPLHDVGMAFSLLQDKTTTGAVKIILEP